MYISKDPVLFHSTVNQKINMLVSLHAPEQEKLNSIFLSLGAVFWKVFIALSCSAFDWDQYSLLLQSIKNYCQLGQCWNHKSYSSLRLKGIFLICSSLPASSAGMLKIPPQIAAKTDSNVIKFILIGLSELYGLRHILFCCLHTAASQMFENSYRTSIKYFLCDEVKSNVDPLIW